MAEKMLISQQSWLKTLSHFFLAARSKDGMEPINMAAGPTVYTSKASMAKMPDTVFLV